jgi:PAS domain S-box-containing protein
VEPPLESPADEVTRLRDALNELRGIMARTALWTGGEPPRIVNTSLDALFGIANEVEERVAQRRRELAKANDALRDSERNSRLVVDSVPGLVALLTAAGELEFVNHQILGYTGRTLEELKQWGTSDTVHAEDLPHVGQVSAESIASGRPYEMVHRLRRSDGVYRWFQNNSFPLRDTSGHIVGWCALLTDIEERKRTEDALRESERESRLIVDTIPGLVAILTPTGEVEFVNNQVLAYCGRTLEELKQWGTSDTVHPEDLPRVIEIISQSMRSGEPYDIEERIRRFDGVYRWFQVRGLPLRDSGGHIVRWYVLLTDIDERRRAEDTLRANELNFRLMVDTIPGMVHTMTATGGVEFVNHQILEFLGKTLEELNDWELLLHPDDRSRVVDRWTHSVATGEPYEAEHRVLCADGTYRWLQSRGLPLRDTSGNIVRWYNLLTDIDERKRAEEALRSSERDLKLIIDTIPAMAWSARPDGSAEFFNQHYLDFIDLSAEQASDWGWTVAVHPEDMNALTATWQRIMASEAPGEAEARLRRHDGEYRWFLFRANPLRDAEEKIVNWYGINTDIEDRKRAEVDLRRAYDSFADAQRLSHTGNFTADIVVDEHVWSDELYRIFEFDPAVKIKVQAVRDVVHPEDLPSFDAGFARSLGGADFDLTFRIVTRSGKLKHVRSLARLIERVAGRPLFIGAIQDVTENKIAEEALNSARSELAHVARVTTLSTLTASIAHEVNQPLSGIITNGGTCLRMLDADPPNIEGARETARRTIRDGHRASEVISRLRALFSKREFTLESLDLNEAIQEVIALSRSDLQRNRVVLQSELADDLPSVSGDRIQLQQVILNLLRNASDAMVDVYDRPRQLMIRTEREDGDRVHVSVRDAGVGIDAQSMIKLFDAFYTTKSDGMGIGLSISRSIIERHHGRLWAEPNDGPGATFSLSIPCKAKGVPMETASEQATDTKVQ